MPYPFVIGETLGATELNAALDMRMLASMSGMGIVPGAVIFGHASNGGFQTDSANLYYDDVNNRLGVLTNAPQAMLQVGKTAGTARVYNSYTDAANGTYGEFSWLSNVLSIGSNQNGTGIVRDVSLRQGGVERLRLTSTGVTSTGGVANSQQLPALLGTAALAAGTRGVTVMGNYAYTTNQTLTPTHTLEIWDITAPTPVKVGGLDFPAQGLGQPVVAGNILYSPCNLAGSGLQIIDISNPKLPVRLSQAGVVGTFIAVSGAYLYQLFGGASAAFQIKDISDPSAPIIKSTLTLTGASGGASIVLQGKYAYVALATQTVGGVGGLYVIDVSDPVNPAVVCTYNAMSNPRGIAIYGRYLYLTQAVAANGIEVIDASDPTNLVQTAVIPTNAGASVYVNPIVAGKYLYTSNGTAANALQIFDITNPANPVSIIGATATVAGPTGYALSGNRLYVAANAQLRVYDTYGVETPTLGAGSINTDQLYVDGPSYFNGDMYAQRSLVVGQAGIFSRGPIVTDASEALVPISAIFGLGLVCVGGNSSAFPALKRSGTAVQVKLGDDSAFGDLEVRNLSVGSPPGVMGVSFEVIAANSNVYTGTNANFGARMAINNTDLTDGNVSRIMFAANNTALTASTYASISAVHLSHTSAAETSVLTFQTRNVGTFAERGRITGTGWGIGANFSVNQPQAMLHVGTGSATARTHNSFTDAANGEWAYLGDWGKTANVATYGTDKNGTGLTRNFQFLAGGVNVFDYGVTTASVLNANVNLRAPMIGSNNTNPLVPLDIEGTFTSVQNYAAIIAPVLASSSTGSQYGFLLSPVFAPTGASLASATAFAPWPKFSGSVAIAQAAAITLVPVELTGYTGVNPTYVDGIFINAGLGLTTTKFGVVNRGINIAASANGHGATSPVYNWAIAIAGATSGAGVGGAVDNRCLSLTVPSGSGAGSTANYAMLITGNGGSGGGGVTTNYCILSDCTAISVMGSLRVGGTAGAVNPTNANAPYMYITVSSGVPTGIPLYSVAGGAAIQWDATNKKLMVYDNITSTWKGVVLA